MVWPMHALCDEEVVLALVFKPMHYPHSSAAEWWFIHDQIWVMLSEEYKDDDDDDDDEKPDETAVFAIPVLAWGGEASFFVRALRLIIGFSWSAEWGPPYSLSEETEK